MTLPAMDVGYQPLKGLSILLLLLALTVIPSRAAPTDAMPPKAKKSPEVIYYEKLAENSQVDKRGDKLGWPMFREDVRNKEREGKDWPQHGAKNDEIPEGSYDEKDLLAETLIRMLMKELEDEELEDVESHYGSDDEQDEPVPQEEAEIPPLRSAPPTEPPTTTATSAHETTATAAAESDAQEDSREDKRVRVEIDGGVPERDDDDDSRHDGEHGEKTTRGPAEEDPYRDYLDMWYRTNIAEDYEDNSLERLRDYLEYLKFTKSTGKKARKGGAIVHKNEPEKKVESDTSHRNKRSIENVAYRRKRGIAGPGGVYLTPAEALQLQQLVVDLKEQQNKYAATLRDLIAEGNDREEYLGYPKLSEEYQAKNRNLFQLAYGLADQYGRNIGY